MKEKKFIRGFKEELIGLAATAGRYAMTVEPMAKRVKNNEPILPLALATIALDIGDGVLTRYVSRKVLGTEGDDTPLRRIADGVLDHATVARIGWEVSKKNPTALPYLGILATRAAVAAGGFNGYHLFSTGEVTKGRNWQKATHMTTAIFGLAANTENTALTHATGLIASAVAWGTVPAHLKDLGINHGMVFREL